MASECPHIIMIMTDQQRFDTIAAWGYDHMVTPNQDRLVREGVSFRQAYCPGATCISSRAAIFTGMYPHTTGVYSFDPWSDHRNWVQDLSDNGYWCVNIGKMHFSPRDVDGGFHERVVVENPTNKTLDNGGADDDWGRYLTLHGLKRPNDRQHTDPDWMRKFQGVPWHYEERFHSDVFIGNSAVSWIQNHQGDRPLFLQVGFTGPHEPWDPLPRHLDLYKDKQMPPRVMREGELDDKPPQHREHLEAFANAGGEARIDLRLASDSDIGNMRRHYYAKITTVDEMLGKVLEALDERGWLDNSLLLFCSDHGEMLGDHGLPYKWLMYDPIVHVPLVIRHPGSIDSPSEVTDLASLMDLGPTVLEAAGIDVPTYFEGRSLMPYLRGEAIAPRDLVFCDDNYQIMIRCPTHKMVYYIGQAAGELYDLEADPGELWNRWEDAGYAVVRDQMKEQLLSWLATSNYYNAGYKRNRSRQYRMRWPTETDPALHGRSAQPKQVDWL
ncbi:MAG: sulfatase-like hydrolase/transferase [Candidatus Latescibacteria bacterium]|nr:sulfatase-like hydrolase/transferase [Candidatus Latescibacterota bacterium]